MPARKILYVTGTRADFGLMVSTLEQIRSSDGLQLQVVVTGMHLSSQFGATVHEIENLRMPIVARVPIDIERRTAASMARGIGQAIIGFTEAFEEARPDLVLVIGDRGEMLAAAITALHLGIPVCHLHGGERSGTVDEPVRHAITKLSHLHFVATEESSERVIRMGELPENVHVTGAPSLDGLQVLADVPRDKILSRLGLNPDDRYLLVLFHPVVQEMAQAYEQTLALMDSLQSIIEGTGLQVVWLAPNADAGSRQILDALASRANSGFHSLTHLPRPEYVAALAHADVLVGNSSSGIIEAATFGTPVVNIGSRQRARQRNANTIDCEPVREALVAALQQALAHGRFIPGNVYGDGQAGARVVRLLETLPLTAELLNKVNSY